MKKIALFLAAVMLVFAFASCTDKPVSTSQTESSSPAESSVEPSESSAEPAEKTVVRIAGLKGPTSIGLVKMIEESANGNTANDYRFTVAGSADEVTPLLIKGELDIAAIPANLASVLFNKTEGAVRIAAVNTLGVLYIVEKSAGVSSVADLKGKTLYCTGKGSTPEYTIRHILKKNGIDPDKDLTLEFKSEPTEVVALLNSAESGVAMLPQPYVTVAENSVEGLKTVIDLNAEWEKAENSTEIITGVAVVRKEFAESNPEAVKAFLSEYADSVGYVNTNVEEAAELVEKYGIVKSAIAKKAIPKCNVIFMSGEDMKESLNVYLGVLYEANPQSVGGKLPGEEIYLILE